MKKETFAIEIGVGVENFKFGITREELKKAVGEPDEIESTDEGIDDEGKIEVYHYDDLDISVEFIEGNDWRLSTIAVSSDSCTLEGVELIGKKINEITSLVDSLNLGEYESDKVELEDDKHEITMLTIYDAGLNFWFEDGELTELQLSPIEEE
jgi:hypothetical protein